MRVDYTLPALQPGTLADTLALGETVAGASFQDQLRGASAVQWPGSWEMLLRLDVRPFTGTYIGPPPRPQSLEINDPQTEHLRWRNMVARHSQRSETRDRSVTSTGHRPVQTMLEMLSDMQQMEDSIVSQNAAVARG